MRSVIFIIVILIAVGSICLNLYLMKKIVMLESQSQEEIKRVRSEAASAKADCKRQIKLVEERTSLEISSIKQVCAKQIQQMREGIETDQAILSNWSEKDLLVNIMIALDGYGSRLDRSEQYYERIASIFEDSDLASKMDIISSDLRSLSTDIKTIKSSLYSQY